ncbi:MAG TPA: CPBP family intramembrane glutamic endopeptidase [Gemmatimonadales bacterium]|nr:CPBP family intramembrane glutamic endopeptidase [Gemmatimonadales bacterium]
MARVSFAGVTRVGIALGWAVLFIAVGIAIIIGLSQVVPGWGGREWFVAQTGVPAVIGFGLSTWIVGRLLKKYSWAELGWRRPAVTPWLRGVAIGAVMACVAIGLAVVLDGARIHFTGDWSLWPRIAPPLIIGLIFAALGEEFGFRGFPLRRLSDAFGVVPAMLLLAILFGLLHAKNPNATVFSSVNVALAAIWLSFAFFSAGGMPLAWGAHFGWNAGLAILFDAPVSGYSFLVPVVEYTPGAHAWVDGGAFGPEGGIVATIALLAGTGWLLTRPSAFSPQPSVETEKVAVA